MTEDEVLDAYAATVAAEARRWSRRSGGIHEVDDLAQEARIALLRAYRRGRLAPHNAWAVASFGIQDYMRTVDRARGQRVPRPVPVGDHQVLDRPVHENGFDVVEDRDVLARFIRWAEWTGWAEERVTLILEHPSQAEAARATGIHKSEVSRVMRQATRRAREYGALCFR